MINHFFLQINVISIHYYIISIHYYINFTDVSDLQIIKLYVKLNVNIIHH